MTVRFKNYVCLRKKEEYIDKWNIICFGAMFFEMLGHMFLLVMILKGPSLIFTSWCLLKSWWKN